MPIMAEYDSIAQSYQQTRKVILSLPEIYTYLTRIGEIAGQSILELGCGEGFYTRKLRQQGAAKVLGIDLSENMIELAKQQEETEPLGVEYLVRDVLELGQIGEFDVVTATFLLNHAQTQAQLLKMCQNLAVNLKSGGRFLAINHNLELSPECYPRIEKYGRRQTMRGPRIEGTPIAVTLFNGMEESTFTDFYLSQATYEWAFQQVGLTEIIWHPLRISPADLQKFGQAFWQDLIDCPTFVVIEGVKK
jgi:ubiquinone/menaquinone biosynthesis C-methylase UbiE